MEGQNQEEELNFPIQAPSATPRKDSSLNLILNSDGSPDTTESMPAIEHPLVIIPGYFKDKEVFLINPDILFNKEELNYRNVSKNKSMSSLDRRAKQKEIIQLATAFYYANSNRDTKRHNNIPSSAVAEYFGIPKQSFHDHIKGVHLNSAVHGSRSKPLVNEDEMNDMENILKIIKKLYIEAYPDNSFAISNKHLQDLYNIIHIRLLISEDELHSLDQAIQLAQSLLYSGNEVARVQAQRKLVTLQLLSKLLTQNSLSDDLVTEQPIFKLLKVELLPDILEELLKIKSASLNSDESDLVKSLSKSTLNRLRKKVGVSCSKRMHVDEELPMNAVGDGIRIPGAEEHLKIAENSTGDQNKIEGLNDIASILFNMQQQLNVLSGSNIRDAALAREKFDSLLGQMTSIINDKDLGQDTITKINNYRKAKDQLLIFLKEVQGAESMGMALVDHISLTSDIILKLLFENVRLKRNAENGTSSYHSPIGQGTSATFIPTITPNAQYDNQREINNVLPEASSQNELRYNEHELNSFKRQRL
ncbi:hypothetical protein MOSE0_F05600 [Monosporozyma servazzii]